MEAVSKPPRRGLLAGIVIALVAGHASAQQTDASAQVPDYAAVLGTSQVVRDAGTGVRRGLTQKEVQQRLDATGAERSSRQRRESRAINEAIHAMPATTADAFRTAKKNSQGIVVVKRSREEIEPMVGIVGPDGRMQASHDPADLHRGEN